MVYNHIKITITAFVYLCKRPIEPSGMSMTSCSHFTEAQSRQTVRYEHTFLHYELNYLGKITQFFFFFFFTIGCVCRHPICLHYSLCLDMTLNTKTLIYLCKSQINSLATVTFMCKCTEIHNSFKKGKSYALKSP